MRHLGLSHWKTKLLLLALLLGTTALRVAAPFWSERAAERQLESWRAQPGARVSVNGSPRQPEWLYSWLPLKVARQLRTAGSVRMASVAIRPEELLRLAGLPELRSLDVRDVDLAETLSEFPVLPRLQSLTLGGVDLADGVLSRIGRSPHLEALDLTETAIGDAGLEHLQGLADVQRLRLSRTRVTSAGLAPVDAPRAAGTLSG